MSEPRSDLTAYIRADLQTHYRLEFFLYDEAALLDQRAYDAWILLISEEIHYAILGRVVRLAEAERVCYPIITADYAMLARRTKQISSPKLTHAENPPSFTRRLVSNVRSFVLPDGDFMTISNFLIYRHRQDTPSFDLYAGERTDVLRINGDLFSFIKRQAQLDQTAFSGSLSIII